MELRAHVPSSQSFLRDRGSKNASVSPPRVELELLSGRPIPRNMGQVQAVHEGGARFL